MHTPQSSPENLCLPDGYQSQPTVSYYEDSPSEVIYQPSVYALAAHLVRQGGYRYIIDVGCGQGHASSRHFAGPQFIGLDFGPNLAEAAKKLPEGRFLETNLESEFTVPEEWAKHAVVVCSDVIEHIADPTALLRSLSRLSKIAPFVLVSTPDRERVRGLEDLGPPENRAHIREWTLGELGRLFARHQILTPYLGYTLSTNRDDSKATSLAIFGAHALPGPAAIKRVLAIVACRNERDVIESCFRHLTEQGVDVCFLDDGSTDGTWEAIQEIRRTQPTRCIHIEQLANEAADDALQLQRILRRKEEITSEIKYDWYVHQDADEFRYAPNPNETLSEAISRIDALGFTALDHTVLDFRPTDNSFTPQCDPPSHFRFFEFSEDFSQLKQIKAFKPQDEPVDLQTSGGHNAQFKSRRIYPLNFQISHFSLRNTKQARAKIFCEMLPRMRAERDQLGWHGHFDRLAVLADFPDYIWPRRNLHSYNPLQFRADFIVERLSRLDVN